MQLQVAVQSGLKTELAESSRKKIRFPVQRAARPRKGLADSWLALNEHGNRPEPDDVLHDETGKEPRRRGTALILHSP